MDNITPAPAPTAPRYRWLWRLCWLVLLLVTGWGVYLVLTGLPALYSPPDKVRKSPGYVARMNPPRLSTVGTNPPPAAPPPVTITTNQGKLRVEYPLSVDNSVDVVGFTMHRIEAGETVPLGELTFRLLRIGHAWAPPSTNWQYGSSGNIPAQFYGPDLQLLPDAQVLRDLPQKWDRTIDCRANRHAYRFDFEVSGGPSRFINAGLYDARTHCELTSGYSQSERGQTVYRLGIDPYMWHQAPVELVVDVATGPVEEELILPQAGSSFTIGPSRYSLIFAGDNLPDHNYTQSSGSKSAYLSIDLPGAQKTQSRVCLLLYSCTPPAAQFAYELAYLDDAGKNIETSGGNSSSGQVMQWVKGNLADIKQIRVRKFRSAHRLVIRLPYLPGLPPENQQVENLFAVRLPRVRFDYEYEEREFITRMTQLELPHISSANLPPGTYPRWFTNATPADVLEDYRQLMGVKEDFFVDQEKLELEKGQRPWPHELQEKLLKLWKKLRRP